MCVRERDRACVRACVCVCECARACVCVLLSSCFQAAVILVGDIVVSFKPDLILTRHIDIHTE